jgi:hypothetical protein
MSMNSTPQCMNNENKQQDPVRGGHGTPFRRSTASLEAFTNDIQTSIIQNIAHSFWIQLKKSDSIEIWPPSADNENKNLDNTFDEKEQIEEVEEITEERILNYLSYVMNDTQLEFECLICAVIYLDRLLHLPTTLKLEFNRRNWRNLFAISALLSSKVWDDFSMANNHFSLVFPTENLQEVNRFEVHALKLLNFNVNISFSTYESYLSQYLAINESPYEDEIDSLMCDSFAEHQSLTSSLPSSPLLMIQPPSSTPPLQPKHQQFLPSSSCSSSPTRPSLSFQQQFFHYFTKSHTSKQKSKLSKVYCC